MDRIAVFVDAGYLFAAGSALLAGEKKPRHLLSIVDDEVEKALTEVCAARAPGLQVLRIYWYDGASANRGPSADQLRLASRDNFKVRFGFLNNAGQQKGVDSLIVMDMVDLARNKAISDAILVSGDEDVRIGVQLAQTFGIRVHLLGIHPCRASQSNQLLQEADTINEWNTDHVRRFLAVKAPPALSRRDAAEPREEKTIVETVTTTVTKVVVEVDASIRDVVTAVVDGMNAADLTAVTTYNRTIRGVPPEFDGGLIGKCRDVIGRQLERKEIQGARRTFLEAVKKRQTDLDEASA